MSDRGPPGWLALMVFATATRAGVLAFGYCASLYLPPLGWFDPSLPPRQESLVMTYYKWDAGYYYDLSRDGYTYSVEKQRTAAFMPLLPVFMASGKLAGFDPHTIGLIVPNIAFIIGLAFFGRAVAIVSPGSVWRACILLCAYPAAMFFSCPYQESLAFLGVSVAWWAWLRGRAAGCAAGIFFACFARLASAAFPVALAAEWLSNVLHGRPARSLKAIALVSFAAGAAICIFYYYLHVTVGDAFAQVKSQAAWGRQPPSLENIARALTRLYYEEPARGIAKMNISAQVALLLFVGLGVRAWWVRGPFYGVLILLPLGLALSTASPMSIERFVLGSFPAFIDLAELLRRPRVFWPVVIAFLVIQGALLDGYVHFQFVG